MILDYTVLPAWFLAAASPGFAAPDVGNLTATAILGWYAWHTAARTIPGLVRAFREEMAAARAEYRAERDVLTDEIALEREQRHADHLAMVTAVNGLAARLPGGEPRD